MKIKKNKLLTLIKEAIIAEFTNGNGLLNSLSHGESINSGELKFYDDIREIKDRAEEIWNIFILSYKDKGGLKSYHSLNHMIKSRPVVKMVTERQPIHTR